ncbi:MAG: DUF4911 domain-containing protein [Desulfosarcina sp.]|nr:DUF4911 domain-containing protein [Desulfosarcina sp.]
METTRRVYRVDRCRIGFVQFILEAYDNVAVLSTLDPRQALVQVVIAPGCESMVDGIMTGLGCDVGPVPVNDTQTDDLSEEPFRGPAGGNG